MPEHVKEYVEIYGNPWPEILEEIKNAGAFLKFYLDLVKFF